MKLSRLLLFPLLLGIFLMNCTPGDRVIENPTHGLTNTNHIAISKIILTDTATIVHFNVYLRGGGISVCSDTYFLEADGELFAITGAEGIILCVPHAENPMPVDRDGSFILYFEPLPRNLRSVNFIGIDCPSCWRIWDINLTGRSRRFTPNLPSDIRNFRADNNATLPEPTMEIGNTTVTVHVNGLRDDFPLRGIGLSVYNNFTLEWEQIDAQEIENNTHTFTFDQFGTTSVAVVIGGYAGSTALHVLVSPGESAEVFIDMKAHSIATSRYNLRPDMVYAGFRGKFAHVNTQLLPFTEQERWRYTMISVMDHPEVLSMSSQEIIEELFSIYHENLAQLDNMNLSPGVRQIFDTELKVNLVNQITQMGVVLANVYRHQNNLPWGTPIDFVAPSATEEEIISALSKLDLNNLMNLYSPRFAAVVHRSLTFSPEMLNEITGTNRGFLQDMQKAFPLIGKASRAEQLSEEEKEILHSTSIPIFAQVYDRIFENTHRRIEEALLRGGFEIAEAPNVSYERLLEAIVAKHRGKVVFVDFWATWCGPCLAAMRTMVPLKAEMKEQGVVTIFITNPSSPKPTWLGMLPDIGGIHYYLTNEQWRALSSRYEIRGVPTFMIFDKTGERAFMSTGFPGNDRLREELEKVW